MLFDKETRYWQEEYREGNLDDIDMPGEIRCLLDGTAEREFINGIVIFLWSLIPMSLGGLFAGMQKMAPKSYDRLQDFLSPASLGLPIDPTLTFMVWVIVLIIAFNVARKMRKKATKRRKKHES